MKNFWTGRRVEAIALLAGGGKVRYRDVARSLGITERSLRRWRARPTPESLGLSGLSLVQWREARDHESLTALLRQKEADFQAYCAADMARLAAHSAREWAEMEKRLARRRR